MPNRVFLSSTYVDLARHRAAAQSAIRQLGAVDVSMEHFGARDERPAAECISLVKNESDLFVGVYAHKYGYMPEGAEMSISEMEYHAASEIPLPRFIYIVDDNCPWIPAHIDSGQNSKRLQEFKAMLLKRHICQRFGTEDQLATKIAADLGRHIAMQNAPRVGPDTPIRKIQHIGLESMHDLVAETEDEWNARRKAIYTEGRNLFLTHVIMPSSRPGQTFDVFIYLIRHQSEDLSDVKLAEFFLGSYWENKVFSVDKQDEYFGIATSAYGTFLCVCKVTFFDGATIYLDRYIDFEAQRMGGSLA
jgi:hypothetical protein